MHAGIAVLFLGVAASSAFLEQRDVRLSPGDSVRAGGYQVTYVRADRPARRRQRRHRRADLASAPCCEVRKGDEHLHAAPLAQLLPDPGRLEGRDRRASSRARPPARWTCAGACAATCGPRCGPTSARSTAPIREADRQVRATRRGDVQALVIAALAERYRRDPPPATFRAIVSPLVSWIWIGGAIVRARRAGGRVAVAGGAAAPRAQPLLGARLGRELSRA